MIWHPISEPIPERLWGSPLLFYDGWSDFSTGICSEKTGTIYLDGDFPESFATHWAEIEWPKDE